MTHQLTIREDDFVEMAFTGDRANIWHGLGNEIDPDESLDSWKIKAGMDWTILPGELLVRKMNAMGSMVDHTLTDKISLYRSDNLKNLGIVSKDFKIVQPDDILEFFRDCIELNGMRMSTAGTLFEGKKFWALAETGSTFKCKNEKDIYNGHLLLMTGTDGQTATTASFVSTRVVCNNTLNIALAENKKNTIRTTHKRIWDPKKVKIDLGLIEESWYDFTQNLNKLAEREMSDIEVSRFLQKTFLDPKKDIEEQSSVVKTVDELLCLYRYGQGAEYCKGTALGVLNAATNMFTHGTGRRNPSSQFMTSIFGKGSDKKELVYNHLLALCD